MPKIIDWFEHEEEDLKEDFSLYPKRKLLIVFWLIFFLAGTIFQIWDLISDSASSNLDFAVQNFMVQIRAPFLTNTFSLISVFGSQYFIFGIAFLISFALFLKRRKKAAVTVFMILLVNFILVLILKDIFGRIRPAGCIYLWDCLSYPSGHATLSFYFYGIVFYLSLRFLKLKGKEIFSLALFFGTAVFLISLSRIYLGYHYFTDIIGGFLLGGICWLMGAILIDFLYQKIR